MIEAAFLAASMAAAAPPAVPQPSAPQSGPLECKLAGEGDAKLRLSGKLGIAAPTEKGTLRGRVRITSPDLPELNGIYVAEWKGMYFSFWSDLHRGIHMHFDSDFGGSGALLLKKYAPEGRGVAWFAGLCSHSLSYGRSEVIE